MRCSTIRITTIITPFQYYRPLLRAQNHRTVEYLVLIGSEHGCSLWWAGEGIEWRTEDNPDVTDNYPSLRSAVNGYHHNYDNRAQGNDSRVNYFKYFHHELEWFEYRQRISAEIASLHHREFVGNYKLVSTYGWLMRFLAQVMPIISGSKAPLPPPPRELQACFLIRVLFKMTPNWFNLFDPRLHAIRGVRRFVYLVIFVRGFVSEIPTLQESPLEMIQLLWCFKTDICIGLTSIDLVLASYS